jgi:hypothetical protein
MRRIAIALTLSAGCFGEPVTDDHVAGTAVTMTTSAEESGSSSGESSSSEDSGSSTMEPDPAECPEWCTGSCDVVLGIHAECRCRFDWECDPGGLSCDIAPEAAYGHCRE